MATNTIFVTTRYDDIVAPRSSFSVDRVSWIAGAPPAALQEVGGSTRLVVQVRHGPAVHAATVTRLPDAPASATGGAVDDPTVLDVELDHLDSGLAPGQYAAFYIDYDNGQSVCLGSGVIRERTAEELVAGVARCAEEAAARVR